MRLQSWEPFLTMRFWKPLKTRLPFPHDLDPAATTLEGYLFPSKYRVYKHTTARDWLARQMTAEVRTRWLGKPRTASLHDTITLASMVEREARRREEQPLVAEVFFITGLPLG